MLRIWKSETARIAVSLIAVLVALQLIFGAYLPVEGGYLGHDYALYLPSMLTGYYWHLNNGWFAVPWFSPSQCGGFPYFADVNSTLYFSLPQFLTFWIPPFTALRLTFLAFAGLGFIGFYLLLRRRFNSSVHAALAGGVFFAFNGFFVYRFLIGHLTFHAFALVPLLALCLLPSVNDRDRWSWWSEGVFVLLAGLILTYMFQSSMVHAMPPASLAVVGMLLIHGWLFGPSWRPWSRMIGAIIVALFLCASRLVAAIALLSHLPRDYYPLTGFAGLGKTVLVALDSLFSSVPMQVANDWLANSQGRGFGRHEYEFGVTVIPFLLLVTAIVWFLHRPPSFKAIGVMGVVGIAAMAIILSSPIFLNWYSADWHAFLKTIPFFRNSGTLICWLCLYVPLVVLGAALALDRISWLRRYGALPAILAIAGVIIINAAADRTYYRNDLYLATGIQDAFIRARSTQTVQPVTHMSGNSGLVKAPNGFIGPNDLMTAGASRIRCYQPMFGYRLERFPEGRLHEGPALAENGGKFNVKNPACYLYPEANACEPGDHFTTEQTGEARSFLQYRPVRFKRPISQQVADTVTMFSLILFALLLPTCIFMAWRRSSEKSGDG